MLLLPMLCAAFTGPPAAGFTPLGDLPSGAFSSTAHAVSHDGTVVVGRGSVSGGLEAMRWSEASGMVTLGDLPGGPVESVARAVSANGLVAAGGGHTGVSIAVRWVGTGPPIALPEFVGGGIGGASARGISFDGTVIIGVDAGPNGTEAFRYDGATLEPLGDLPGGNTLSQAFGVSGDGTTVVGWSSSADGAEPFVWRDGVMTGLGTLPGGAVFGEARAVNEDGRIIVGWSDAPEGRVAFRTVDGGPMESLGGLPGGDFDARAYALTPDGDVIVGRGKTESGFEAAWWFGTGPARRLVDVLADAGVVVPSGFTLTAANGVSADGRVIVGTGTNANGATEAWRAVLPTAPCPADADGDGAIAFGDVLAVLTGWGTGDPAADITDDGVVDFADLLAVLTAWGTC